MERIPHPVGFILSLIFCQFLVGVWGYRQPWKRLLEVKLVRAHEVCVRVYVCVYICVCVCVCVRFTDDQEHSLSSVFSSFLNVSPVFMDLHDHDNDFFLLFSWKHETRGM